MLCPQAAALRAGSRGGGAAAWRGPVRGEGRSCSLAILSFGCLFDIFNVIFQDFSHPENARNSQRSFPWRRPRPVQTHRVILLPSFHLTVFPDDQLCLFQYCLAEFQFLFRKQPQVGKTAELPGRLAPAGAAAGAAPEPRRHRHRARAAGPGAPPTPSLQKRLRIFYVDVEMCRPTELADMFADFSSQRRSRRSVTVSTPKGSR